MPDTIYTLMKRNRRNKVKMNPIQIKLYAYQMLKAMNYIDSIGVCHRDVKPSNILVDEKTNNIQVCDFGSAKRLSPSEQNIAYICSRYYRAPELIFGAVYYTNQIDVWSTACVIAETILDEPIFPGSSATDQLVQIVKICGNPNPEDIKAMNPSFKIQNFKSQYSKPITL